MKVIEPGHHLKHGCFAVSHAIEELAECSSTLRLRAQMTVFFQTKFADGVLQILTLTAADILNHVLKLVHGKEGIAVAIIRLIFQAHPHHELQIVQTLVIACVDSAEWIKGDIKPETLVLGHTLSSKHLQEGSFVIAEDRHVLHFGINDITAAVHYGGRDQDSAGKLLCLNDHVVDEPYIRIALDPGLGDKFCTAAGKQTKGFQDRLAMLLGVHKDDPFVCCGQLDLLQQIGIIMKVTGIDIGIVGLGTVVVGALRGIAIQTLQIGKIMVKRMLIRVK